MTSTPPPPTSELQPHMRVRMRAAKRAGDNLDQRRADFELVTRAALANFEGQEWREIVGELAAYGWGVAFGWLLKGKMPARCSGANRSCPTLDRRTLDPEWAESLATDLVVESIQRFRDDVLRPQVWDPTRGTTLKSFFVGQMLKQFANVYRQWAKTELRSFKEVEPEEDDAGRHGSDSAENRALDLVEVDRLLKESTDQTKRILLMHAIDRPHKEIADRLGITIGAVNSAIHRARKNR